MTKEELKKIVVTTIDENRDTIINMGKKIYENPEYGYQEFETTKIISEFLKKELNLDVEENIAYTGCKASFNNDKKGPTIAILGELDGISCNEHENALENGATHSCGHNIQLAGMLGAAIGLIKSKASNLLNGKIDLIATPSEEIIQFEYRSKLKKEGKIKFFGGKQELVRKGYFDNVDMSIMFHSMDTKEKKVAVGTLFNGFLGKEIKFIGKESHAGAAPYDGINALNAAVLALNNIHAQRETFKEEDKIRFHAIITKGGDIVNVVPADVRLEACVRAGSIKSMVETNEKINRGLIAGAMAIGAKIEITEIPGYLPLLKHELMENILMGNLKYLGIKEYEIIDDLDLTASTDFGDLSCLMPTLHPMFGGIEGGLHTREFKIVDEERAYIEPAKAMALTVVDLLFDEAKKAKEILENFEPLMTKEKYLEFMNLNDKIIKL